MKKVLIYSSVKDNYVVTTHELDLPLLGEVDLDDIEYLVNHLYYEHGWDLRQLSQLERDCIELLLEINAEELKGE